MKYPNKDPLVVQLAYEIIGLYESNLRLQQEVEKLREYREKYDKLLDSSIQHSEVMTKNILEAFCNIHEADINKKEEI